MLELAHNVAHSNTRFGLRFFKLSPRKYPCQDTKNTREGDMFADNPSVKYTYKDETYYKNGESGVLAEFFGTATFEDYLLADNYRAGF